MGTRITQRTNNFTTILTHERTRTHGRTTTNTTTETAADSTAASPEPTAPRGRGLRRGQEAAPCKADPVPPPAPNESRYPQSSVGYNSTRRNRTGIPLRVNFAITSQSAQALAKVQCFDHSSCFAPQRPRPASGRPCSSSPHVRTLRAPPMSR